MFGRSACQSFCSGATCKRSLGATWCASKLPLETWRLRRSMLFVFAGDMVEYWCHTLPSSLWFSPSILIFVTPRPPPPPAWSKNNRKSNQEQLRSHDLSRDATVCLKVFQSWVFPGHLICVTARPWFNLFFQVWRHGWVSMPLVASKSVESLVSSHVSIFVNALDQGKLYMFVFETSGVDDTELSRYGSARDYCLSSEICSVWCVL